jgi:hypothetical protein
MASRRISSPNRMLPASKRWVPRLCLRVLRFVARKYLLRDRDAIYGDVFARRVKGMGIHEVLGAGPCLWTNGPFWEKLR